jgi:nitrogenase molybdenum-iron protein NifN
VGSIRDMGKALGTIQLGRSLDNQSTAAAHLEQRFGVRALTSGIPIGIRETDRFMNMIEELSGSPTPQKYLKERGRLVDSYIDGHKYVFGKRAVIYGEVDFVTAVASFLDEIGIVPALCATGAATGRFGDLVRSVLENNLENLVTHEDTDFESMREVCKDIAPDLIIGNSKGYYLSRKLGVPLVRVGFPIHDRIGGQRILHVGYRGTQQLFDRIVNALIEFRQNGSSVGYSYI